MEPWRSECSLGHSVMGTKPADTCLLNLNSTAAQVDALDTLEQKYAIVAVRGKGKS